MWHSNKYFRGTNSYRSPNSDHKIPIRTKLSEPIGGKKPVIMEQIQFFIFSTIS